MGSKAFPLLGLLLATIVLLIISSEMAARNLAQAQTSFYQKNGTVVPCYKFPRSFHFA
jgi:hypothetical protein